LEANSSWHSNPLTPHAFENKLAEFSSSEAAEVFDTGGSAAPDAQPTLPTEEAAKPSGIDKSVLTIAVPRRYRNRDHLRFVTQQPCLLCGRKPSDAHHIRFVQPPRAGNEKAWWEQAGIDPLKIARKLWKQTRTLEGRIAPEPMRQELDPDQTAKSGGDGHLADSPPPA